jgi:hypothetical protein
MNQTWIFASAGSLVAVFFVFVLSAFHPPTLQPTQDLVTTMALDQQEERLYSTSNHNNDMEDTIKVADFSGFGFRELEMAAELLDAYSENPIDCLDQETLKVAMNTNSGYVFLTDAEFNVAMMNDGELEQFFSCPECGLEGFKDDFKEHKECEGYKSMFGEANEEDE